MELDGAAPADVLVVGSGAASVLVAHALQGMGLLVGSRVTIVGDGAPAEPGRGIAYGTVDPGHLMNVRAGRLSVSAGDPAHFVAWLERRGEPWTAADYVPRRLYGDYLVDVLDEIRHDGRLELDVVDGSVVRLQPWSDSVEAHLADGRTLSARQVVLATGWPAAPPPAFVSAVVGDPAVVTDPWAPGALRRLLGARRVLILGTGLTMVDVVSTLTAQDPRVELAAISRHGLVSRRHPAVARRTSGPLDLPPGPLTAAALRRAIVEHAGNEPNGWAATIDHVRDNSPALWARLPDHERRKLYGHLARVWDVHRHRMAPEVAERMNALLGEGRLMISKGTILDVEADGDGLRAVVSSRRDGVRTIAIDALVVCAGPVSDITASPDPLLRQLLEDGVAVPGPGSLGLAVDGDGWLVDAGGWHQPRISTIGALRRGTEWETTAIPDLRVQAQAIAQGVARSVRPIAVAVSTATPTST